MIPTDKDFFKIMIGTFVVPIMYFLGLLLLTATGYCIHHTMENTSYIVLAAVLFVCAYNAFRFGWIYRS